MGTLPNERIRVLVCGAGADETGALVANLVAEGLRVTTAAGTADALSALRQEPHQDVVILGSGPSLEDRLGLVRSIRRDVRLAGTRLIWLARRDGADRALESGVDDFAPWPLGRAVLAARVREQAAEAKLHRIAEREAALRAELSRVDEALSRTDAERAELRAQLVQSARSPTPSGSPALTPAQGRGASPSGPHPTVEFGAVERRLVVMLRDQHRASPREAPLSALIVGLDGWDALVEGRGGDLAERLLEALRELLRSLVGPPAQVEVLDAGRFCLLLPGFDEAAAVRLARDVCAQIAAAPVKVAPRPYQPTVSVGVATLEVGATGSPFDVVDWARRAAQVARERGGNRWWVHHREVGR